MLDTYTVEVDNPTAGTAFTVELIATSPAAAIARTRGTLFHRFRDVSFMEPSTTYTVTDVEPLRPTATATVDMSRHHGGRVSNSADHS